MLINLINDYWYIFNISETETSSKCETNICKKTQTNANCVLKSKCTVRDRLVDAKKIYNSKIPRPIQRVHKKIEAIDTSIVDDTFDVDQYDDSDADPTFELSESDHSSDQSTDLKIMKKRKNIPISELHTRNPSNEASSKTKKNFCIYCKKLVTKIPRHLQTVHKTEKDVIEFTSLPKGMFHFHFIIFLSLFIY